jgi:hypothetical protein
LQRTHGVVLELGLAQWRAVSGNQDQLGLSRAEGLEGGFGAHGDFSGLHDERQARGDGVSGLLCFGHVDWRGVDVCFVVLVVMVVM